ncbi:MAG TPA: TraR/DksA C4-type zinc finger protein [Anaerolineae bacterium]|nr:TraR/DksA C4-type zinc finger protein [Anaerolineae bacterium]
MPAVIATAGDCTQAEIDWEDVLTEEKWGQVREKLEAEQAETVAEMSHLKEVLKYELEADPEEGDPDLYEREKILALLGNLEEKQYSLSHALTMMDDGTYGKCEVCGQEIGAERLEALPYTTYCVNCKALVERGIVARPARELAR